MALDSSNLPNEDLTTTLDSQTPIREHRSSGDAQAGDTSPSHEQAQLEESQESSPVVQTLESHPPPEEGGEEEEGESQVKPQSICQICKVKPPKYKCPRCYLPYCSVACNKIHRENHPPDPEPQLLPKTAQVPQVSQDSSIIAADAPDPSNPFRALETSEALKMLFQKYPGLPSQLLEIHAATLPPKEAPDKVIPASLMQGVTTRKSHGWNHDIGIKNGKAALRRAKKDTGQAGEAIREYTELILHIMNEASQKEDTNNYIQQQSAKEDTKLIERLMAEEQHKR